MRRNECGIDSGLQVYTYTKRVHPVTYALVSHGAKKPGRADEHVKLFQSGRINARLLLGQVVVVILPANFDRLCDQGPLQVALAQSLQVAIGLGRRSTGGRGERRQSEGLDQLFVCEVGVLSKLEDLDVWQQVSLRAAQRRVIMWGRTRSYSLGSSWYSMVKLESAFRASPSTSSRWGCSMR